jgi:hypothetical protein
MTLNEYVHHDSMYYCTRVYMAALLAVYIPWENRCTPKRQCHQTDDRKIPTIYSQQNDVQLEKIADVIKPLAFYE